METWRSSEGRLNSQRRVCTGRVRGGRLSDVKMSSDVAGPPSKTLTDRLPTPEPIAAARINTTTRVVRGHQGSVQSVRPSVPQCRNGVGIFSSSDSSPTLDRANCTQSRSCFEEGDRATHAEKRSQELNPSWHELHRSGCMYPNASAYTGSSGW